MAATPLTVNALTVTSSLASSSTVTASPMRARVLPTAITSSASPFHDVTYARFPRTCTPKAPSSAPDSVTEAACAGPDGSETSTIVSASDPKAAT